MDTFYRIELFGGLRVVQSNLVHSHFRTKKAASLLAYLALDLRKPQSRDHLAELLWPEKQIEVGRKNLSTAIAQLRRQLEADGMPKGSLIIATGQQVFLYSKTVSTDVVDFEGLLRQVNQTEDKRRKATLLQQAMELYQGDLLSGDYEDWVTGVRIDFSSRYLESVKLLSRLLEETEQYAEVLPFTRKALAADPYDEDVGRRQIRVLVHLQQPSAALQTYEQLEQVYRRDLNIPLSQETRQMGETLRQDPLAVALLHTDTASDGNAIVHSAHLPAIPAPAAIQPVSSAPTAPILPLRLTDFFGREQERKLLAELLLAPDVRLVTVQGPGGVGKTRMAVEVAAQVAPAFANRVWFVPLANISDASLFATTVVNRLHVPPGDLTDPLERTVDYLGNSTCLLVLDNLEHLLPLRQPVEMDNIGLSGISALIRLLLERVPGLTCLTTSRQALGLGGEKQFSLPPLALPPKTATASAAAIRSNESVALYMDRARNARLDFMLTDQNADSVAALCRQLEGMPLAIELAAAWARTITPQTMLERLKHQWDQLASHRRDLPARQRSIRATITWSYDLLTTELQQFFARLSVFADGWTLEAAESVCSGGMVDNEKVLELLENLIDWSLVVPEERQGVIRYRFLNAIREFSHECLQAAGEEALYRMNHFRFFLRQAEEVEPKLTGMEQVAGLQWFDVEHENLRAALDWNWGRSDAEAGEAGLRLCGALQQFWGRRGYLSEGLEQCIRALEKADALDCTLARAKVFNAAGIFAWMQGDQAVALAYHTESLAINRKIGNRNRIAASLGNLGNVATAQGDYTAALPYYKESLAFYREIGDKRRIAISLGNLGNVAKAQRDHATARAYYEESLALNREIGDKGGIAVTLGNLGQLAFVEGDHITARSNFEESLALNREIGDRRSIAVALKNLGQLAFAEGDHTTAGSYFEESLALNREIGDKGGVAVALAGIRELMAQKQTEWAT